MHDRAGSTVGLIALSMTAGAALVLLLQSTPMLMKGASAAGEKAFSVPDAWNLDALSTMPLEVQPDIDWTPIESGTARNSETLIYEGENVAVVWEAGPAKIVTENPFPYDEFIVVLKGKLVLTDQFGKTATYKKGDMLVVPKGFTGTWDMPEVFRELVLIERNAYYAEP